MSVSYRDRFAALREPLLAEFGFERVEETAFPVYFHRLPPVSWLGWKRIETTQRLLHDMPGDGRALDFGAGLGTLLPFLAERFGHVTAVDVEPEITRFTVSRLGLSGIEIVESLDGLRGPYDAVVALDVLEHVDDLDSVCQRLLELTAPGGRWVVSGPLENALYRMGRFVARTSGEKHRRGVHAVMAGVPAPMQRVRRVRLPAIAPFFLVDAYEKPRG